MLIKQVFIIAQVHAGCGIHLKGDGAVFGVHCDGAALAACQDTCKLAHAVGVRANELYPDFLALEGLVVLRAGELTAKAGAANLQIIALVDGVYLLFISWVMEKIVWFLRFFSYFSVFSEL